MHLQNIKEINSIIKDKYGISISKTEYSTVDTPDSAMYIVVDQNGNKYVLRESDYLSELQYEKQDIETELNIKISDWVQLLKKNDQIVRDEHFAAYIDGMYYLLARVKSGQQETVPLPKVHKISV